MNSNEYKYVRVCLRYVDTYFFNPSAEFPPKWSRFLFFDSFSLSVFYNQILIKTDLGIHLDNCVQLEKPVSIYIIPNEHFDLMLTLEPKSQEVIIHHDVIVNEKESK